MFETEGSAREGALEKMRRGNVSRTVRQRKRRENGREKKRKTDRGSGKPAKEKVGRSTGDGISGEDPKRKKREKSRIIRQGSGGRTELLLGASGEG